MSIHNIKEIISYVPEALEFTKQAHVEKEFPTNSKDSTILSALEIAYLTKVANQKVDYEVSERVEKASRLYGVMDKVAELSGLLSSRVMEKKASDRQYQDEVRQAEEVIESMRSGLVDLEKIASRSESLYDEYPEYVTSDLVKLYAGEGTLNKEAAELALAVRYKKTGEEGFMKVAKIIHNSDVSKLTPEDNRSIAHAVLDLEKKAQMYGMDFYRDAFMVKSASISNATTVTINGKSVPVSKIIAVAPSISNVIGEDVAKSIEDGGPEEVKAIVESLPLDLKSVIAKYA